MGRESIRKSGSKIDGKDGHKEEAAFWGHLLKKAKSRIEAVTYGVHKLERVKEKYGSCFGSKSTELQNMSHKKTRKIAKKRISGRSGQS